MEMVNELPDDNNVTIAEAKEILNISWPTLMNRIREYQVNNRPLAIKIGGRWKISLTQMSLFERGLGRPKPEPGTKIEP